VNNTVSPLNRFKNHLQTVHREKILFLLVGAGNTLFGITLYWALLACFSKHVNYLVLLVPNQIIAVTVAFFCYKYVVFTQRTAGSLFGSYLRFFIVSTSNALLGSALIVLLVHHFRVHPAYANAVSVIIVAVVSYICHKHISFRRSPQHLTPASTKEAAHP